MNPEDQAFNIALVYLGNKTPKYLESNLRYLQGEFPNYRSWLITDNLSVKQDFMKKGFNVWFYKSSVNTWDEIYRNMNFPKEFRNGFWFLTLKRFKALEAFMTENDGPLLHVEADVILLPKFPFQELIEIKKDLAYPTVGEGYAIASTFFIKNFQAIDQFNQYILEQSRTDPNLIDMTALYNYAKHYPKRVHSLPSGPTAYPNRSGYFDGAAFGTFLFGQDPRNRRGLALKYSRIGWHTEEIEKMNFYIVEDKLYVRFNEQQARIYSLHLHSKEAKLFNKTGLIKGLRVAIREYESGPKSVFKFTVLPRLILDALIRRMSRRKFNE